MLNGILTFIAIIVTFLIGLFIATKKMCQNIDSVDEDENGFFDRRDKV